MLPTRYPIDGTLQELQRLSTVNACVFSPLDTHDCVMFQRNLTYTAIIDWSRTRSPVPCGPLLVLPPHLLIRPSSTTICPLIRPRSPRSPKPEVRQNATLEPTFH